MGLEAKHTKKQSRHDITLFSARAKKKRSTSLRDVPPHYSVPGHVFLVCHWPGAMRAHTGDFATIAAAATIDASDESS